MYLVSGNHTRNRGSRLLGGGRNDGLGGGLGRHSLRAQQGQGGAAVASALTAHPEAPLRAFLQHGYNTGEQRAPTCF